jgi:hypothetical protein
MHKLVYADTGAYRGRWFSPVLGPGSEGGKERTASNVAEMLLVSIGIWLDGFVSCAWVASAAFDSPFGA